jgi:hypothetical protein
MEDTWISTNFIFKLESKILHAFHWVYHALSNQRNLCF